MHWEIKDQIIRINLNGRFTIEWTEDVIDYGKNDAFFTRDEAERAINEALALKAQKMIINYAVIRADGVTATITGVNRNTSYAIVKSETPTPSGMSSYEAAYPDLPIVRELLNKIFRLEGEISELKIPLRKVRIDLHTRSGRISPENYDDILALLSERVDKAYEEARKLIPTT